YLAHISLLCLFIGDVIRHIRSCGRESKSSEWIVQFSPIVEFAGHKVLISREKSTVIGRDELKLPAGGKVFEDIAFISPVVDRKNRGHSRAGNGWDRPQQRDVVVVQVRFEAVNNSFPGIGNYYQIVRFVEEQLHGVQRIVA